MRRVVVWMLMGWIGVGCAGRRSIARDASVARGVSCEALAPETFHEVIPASSTSEDRAVAVGALGPRAAHIAEILGVLPDVVALTDADIDPLHQLGRLDHIRARVLDASLALSGLLAELECEEERVEGLAAAVSGARDAHHRQLTLSAIVVGAVTGVAAGSLALAGEGRAAEITAIGGAVAEGAIGGVMLGRARKVELPLRRNHLQPIGTGEDPLGLYPPVVWSLLSLPVAGESLSRREGLAVRWAETSTEAELDRLYGPGGAFRPSELEHRADRIDELDAELGMLKGDLRALLAAVEALVRRAP